MDVSIVLVFIIISALLAMIALFVFRKGRGQDDEEEAANDYADGLNYLLNGDKENALKKLRRAVSKNSQNIDAYLKIGDILRDLGQVERAINVHKYLTVRPGLSFKTRQDILQSLTSDYIAAQEYDKALGVVQKVLSEDRHAAWAHQMKLKIFEHKQDWTKAFQTYKDSKKYLPDFDTNVLADYKVKEGLQFLEENRDKEAQACFKEAIKIAPENASAYIHLADSYVREDRKRDALKILKDFVTRNPANSFVAFERIKELMYEGGVYGEIEHLYEDIIRRQPDNVSVLLALAENYEKKGELDKAIQTSLNVLERDSGNRSAKKYLVRLYHKTGDKDEALKYALELIDNSVQN